MIDSRKGGVTAVARSGDTDLAAGARPVDLTTVHGPRQVSTPSTSWCTTMMALHWGFPSLLVLMCIASTLRRCRAHWSTCY